jgi:hypothetical protein
MNKMTAQMICSYDDNRPYKTHVLESQDVNEVYEFLKKNCTTAGFSVQYGISTDDRVIELFKKGKLGKRDIQKVIAEYGINEWHYSWCWSSKIWLVRDTKTTAVQVDLSPVQTMKEALRYRNVL